MIMSSGMEGWKFVENDLQKEYFYKFHSIKYLIMYKWAWHRMILMSHLKLQDFL